MERTVASNDGGRGHQSGIEATGLRSSSARLTARSLRARVGLADGEVDAIGRSEPEFPLQDREVGRHAGLGPDDGGGPQRLVGVVERIGVRRHLSGPEGDREHEGEHEHHDDPGTEGDRSEAGSPRAQSAQAVTSGAYGACESAINGYRPTRVPRLTICSIQTHPRASSRSDSVPTAPTTRPS